MRPVTLIKSTGSTPGNGQGGCSLPMHFRVLAVVVAVVSCSQEGLEGDDAGKHADVAVLVAAADEARDPQTEPRP